MDHRGSVFRHVIFVTCLLDFASGVFFFFRFGRRVSTCMLLQHGQQDRLLLETRSVVDSRRNSRGQSPVELERESFRDPRDPEEQLFPVHNRPGASVHERVFDTGDRGGRVRRIPEPPVAGPQQQPTEGHPWEHFPRSQPSTFVPQRQSKHPPASRIVRRTRHHRTLPARLLHLQDQTGSARSAELNPPIPVVERKRAGKAGSTIFWTVLSTSPSSAGHESSALRLWVALVEGVLRSKLGHVQGRTSSVLSLAHPFERSVFQRVILGRRSLSDAAVQSRRCRVRQQRPGEASMRSRRRTDARPVLDPTVRQNRPIQHPAWWVRLKERGDLDLVIVRHRSADRYVHMHREQRGRQCDLDHQHPTSAIDARECVPRVGILKSASVPGRYPNPRGCRLPTAPARR